MANTLVELNEILFAELHKLKASKSKGDELQNELRKANAITQVAKTIVQNADVLLKAQVVESEKLACCQELPSMLRIEGGAKK